MTMIPIPDDIYAILSDKAQKLGVSVEQLVLQSVERAVAACPSVEDRSIEERLRAFEQSQKAALARAAAREPSPEERRRALDAWDASIQSRADRYPADFRVDDSRETIYFGREDGPK